MQDFNLHVGNERMFAGMPEPALPPQQEPGLSLACANKLFWMGIIAKGVGYAVRAVADSWNLH